MTIEARLTFTTQLIREAGELAAGYFAHRATLMRETKGPQDFVSIADREVESLIRTRLAQAFPEDGFLGEESGGAAGERCWVVDPIDGTNNFLRGLPFSKPERVVRIYGEAKERDLKQLTAEARRASEIVSRLVSFAHPSETASRLVDVNALTAGLMQFREPEWKALALRVQNHLSPEPALVLGVQGQLEEVFLNLLVHGEQAASGSAARTLPRFTASLNSRKSRKCSSLY